MSELSSNVSKIWCGLDGDFPLEANNGIEGLLDLTRTLSLSGRETLFYRPSRRKNHVYNPLKLNSHRYSKEHIVFTMRPRLDLDSVRGVRCLSGCVY